MGRIGFGPRLVRCRYWESACEAIDGLEHFIGGADYARVGLVRTLGKNHLNEFRDHVNVGVFERTLDDGSKTFGAAGSADDGIAGSGGFREVVVSSAA